MQIGAETDRRMSLKCTFFRPLCPNSFRRFLGALLKWQNQVDLFQVVCSLRLGRMLGYRQVYCNRRCSRRLQLYALLWSRM
jgi:hypothetical protein